jgi:hypothetical protein
VPPTARKTKKHRPSEWTSITSCKLKPGATCFDVLLTGDEVPTRCGAVNPQDHRPISLRVLAGRQSHQAAPSGADRPEKPGLRLDLFSSKPALLIVTTFSDVVSVACDSVRAGTRLCLTRQWLQLYSTRQPRPTYWRSRGPSAPRQTSQAEVRLPIISACCSLQAVRAPAAASAGIVRSRVHGLCSGVGGGTGAGEDNGIDHNKN